MVQHYYYSYLNAKYSDDKTFLNDNLQIGITPFRVEHILGAVLVLACGVALGSLAFVWERTAVGNSNDLGGLTMFGDGSTVDYFFSHLPCLYFFLFFCLLLPPAGAISSIRSSSMWCAPKFIAFAADLINAHTRLHYFSFFFFFDSIKKEGGEEAWAWNSISSFLFSHGFCDHRHKTCVVTKKQLGELREEGQLRIF